MGLDLGWTHLVELFKSFPTVPELLKNSSWFLRYENLTSRNPTISFFKSQTLLIRSKSGQIQAQMASNITVKNSYLRNYTELRGKSGVSR